MGRAVEDELSALRPSLWRLIGDEEIDVVTQARAVSEVVGMTVRATREHGVVRKAGEREEQTRIVALLDLLGSVSNQ